MCILCCPQVARGHAQQKEQHKAHSIEAQKWGKTFWNYIILDHINSVCFGNVTTVFFLFLFFLGGRLGRLQRCFKRAAL